MAALVALAVAAVPMCCRFQYLVLDDCWSERSREEGERLQASKEKFPSGMKVRRPGLPRPDAARRATRSCSRPLPLPTPAPTSRRPAAHPCGTNTI